MWEGERLKGREKTEEEDKKRGGTQIFGVVYLGSPSIHPFVPLSPFQFVFTLFHLSLLGFGRAMQGKCMHDKVSEVVVYLILSLMVALGQ
jgi:hypothetical protein